MAGKGILDVVVENILDNAIGFCPRGKAIILTLQRRRQDVLLRIEDEGPGIRPGEIDHVFDRYVSLRRPEDQPADVARAANGADHAGLGLWIVRRNVESLGGRVSAANRASGGLAIEVVLPAAE
jgi:two-component system sensor histidine kinase ChvG